MKIASIQLVVASIGVNAHAKGVWEPPRLDYRDLLHSVNQSIGADAHGNAENKIHDALLTGTGVLSLTNVITQSEKEKLYDAMVECYSSSDSAKEVVYLDGTKRSTWAAPSSGDLKACNELNEVSDPIREKIGEATSNLASLIEATLTTLDQYVVFPKSAGEDGYGLKELISQGEQLDHFHIYSSKGADSEENQAAPKTIDWHTDYGFALAFIPGQVLAEDNSSRKYTPSKGFFIQLPDGSAKEVTFTEEDDVVILLGDGVSHINNAIEDDSINLRPVPHSFVMPDADDVLRMWYGRMLLFPVDMIHSTLNQSFGEVKEAMNSDPSYHISNVDNQMGYALGCSSPEVLAPRLLADEMMTCEDDQFMCWHACFNHTEDVSPAACESRDLELACVSSVDGSIWDGETHSKEFGPECILADDAVVDNESNSTSTSVIGSIDSPTATPNVDETPAATESPTSSSALAGLYSMFYVLPTIAFIIAF